jgi:hypothetical protein
VDCRAGLARLVLVAAVVLAAVSGACGSSRSEGVSFHFSTSHAGQFVFLGDKTGSHYRIERQGNVAASFDPSNSQSVTSALARLH